MNTLTVLLLCLTVIALVYLLKQPRRRLRYDGRSDYWWPANWNFDWGGGPAYDRHRIMRERGPYHQNYGPPHSTRGGDGRARR
jgi:hypothetical protein